MVEDNSSGTGYCMNRELRRCVANLRPRVVLMLLVLFFGFNRSRGAESDDDFFESKIRPILTERSDCHSAEKGKTHGGLAPDTKQGWEKGGESVQRSCLDTREQSADSGGAVRRRWCSDAAGRSGRKTARCGNRLLKQWVQQGAHDPRTGSGQTWRHDGRTAAAWWSFQPLKPVRSLPSGTDSGCETRSITLFGPIRLGGTGVVAGS